MANLNLEICDSLWIEFLSRIENDSNRKEELAADGRRGEPIIVVSSDSEDETENEKIWSTYAKSKGFNKLREKAKFLIFHHIISSYSNAKNQNNLFEFEDENQISPYQQLSNDLRKFQQDDSLKIEELAHLWENVIHWLIAIKQSSNPLDLNHDEKFNLILIDFMVQYMNYKTKLHCCKSYANQDQDIQEVVGQIMKTMSVIFNGRNSLIIMTLLRIELNVEYHYILDPIFRKCLTDCSLYKKSNDFVVYIRLVLCFKRWKMITELKADREKINEIAVGSTKVVDLTTDPILPKSVPNLNDKNKAFVSISDLIRYAMTPEKKKTGTLILLINKSLDVENAISTYFRLYERLITGQTDSKNEHSAHVLTKLRTVNARLQHRSHGKYPSEKTHLSKICDKPNQSDISITERSYKGSYKSSYKSSNISEIYIHPDLSDDDDDLEKKNTKPKPIHYLSISEKNNLFNNEDICSIPIVSNISIPTNRCRILSVASKPTRKEEHCIPGVVSSTTGLENIADKGNKPNLVLQKINNPDILIVGSKNSDFNEISNNESNFSIVQDHLLSSTSEGLQKTPSNENIVFSTPITSGKIEDTPFTNVHPSSSKQVANILENNPWIDDIPTCSRYVNSLHSPENEFTLNHNQVKGISAVNTQLERCHIESKENTKIYNTKIVQINNLDAIDLSQDNFGETDVFSQPNECSEDKNSESLIEKEFGEKDSSQNVTSESDKSLSQFKHLNEKQSLSLKPEQFSKHKITNNDAESSVLSNLVKSNPEPNIALKTNFNLNTECLNILERKTSSNVKKKCSNNAMLNLSDKHDVRRISSEDSLTLYNKKEENEEEHIIPRHNSDDIFVPNALIDLNEVKKLKTNPCNLKKCIVKIKRLNAKEAERKSKLLSSKKGTGKDSRVVNDTVVKCTTPNITKHVKNSETQANIYVTINSKNEDISKRSEDKDSDDTANEVIANLRLLENSSMAPSIKPKVDLCSSEKSVKNLQRKELTNELEQSIETVLQLTAEETNKVCNTNNATDYKTAGIESKSPNKVRFDVLAEDEMNSIYHQPYDIFNYEDILFFNNELMDCEFMNDPIFTNTDSETTLTNGAKRSDLQTSKNGMTHGISQSDYMISGSFKNPSDDIAFDYDFSPLNLIGPSTQPCEKNNETSVSLEFVACDNIDTNQSPAHSKASVACDNTENSTNESSKKNENNNSLEHPKAYVACNMERFTTQKSNKTNQSHKHPKESVACNNIKTSTNQSCEKNETNKSLEHPKASISCDNIESSSRKNSATKKSCNYNKNEIKHTETTKIKMSASGTVYWKKKDTKTPTNSQKSLSNVLTPVLNSGDIKKSKLAETTEKDLKNSIALIADSTSKRPLNTVHLLSENFQFSLSGQTQAIVRLQDQTNRLEIIDKSSETFSNTLAENGSLSERSSTPTLDEQINFEISHDRPNKRDSSPQSKVPPAKKFKADGASTSSNKDDVFDMLKQDKSFNNIQSKTETVVTSANALNTDCGQKPKIESHSTANDKNFIDKTKFSHGQLWLDKIGSNLIITTNNDSNTHSNLKYQQNKTFSSIRIKNHAEGASETAKTETVVTNANVINTECKQFQKPKIELHSTVKKSDPENDKNLIVKNKFTNRQLSHAEGNSNLIISTFDIHSNLKYPPNKTSSTSNKVPPKCIKNHVEGARETAKSETVVTSANSINTECGQYQKLKFESHSTAKKSDLANDKSSIDKNKFSDRQLWHDDISSNLTITTNNGFDINSNLKYPPNETSTNNEIPPKRIKNHVEGARETAKTETFVTSTNAFNTECGQLQKLKIKSHPTEKKPDLENDKNLIDKKFSDKEACHAGDISPNLILTTNNGLDIHSNLKKPPNKTSSTSNDVPPKRMENHVEGIIEADKAETVFTSTNVLNTECGQFQKLKIESHLTTKKFDLEKDKNLIDKNRQLSHAGDISSNLMITTNNGFDIHSNLKQPPNKTFASNEVPPKRIKNRIEGARETAQPILETGKKNLIMKKSSETTIKIHGNPKISTANPPISSTQVSLPIQLSKADQAAIDEQLKEFKKSLPYPGNFRIHRENTANIELKRDNLTKKRLEELQRERSRLQKLKQMKRCNSLPSNSNETKPTLRHQAQKEPDKKYVPRTREMPCEPKNASTDEKYVPLTTENPWEPINASTEEIIDYFRSNKI